MSFQQIFKIIFLEKLKKWAQLLKDDILAEEGAIILYNSHITAFQKDFLEDIEKLRDYLENLGLEPDKVAKIILALAGIVKRQEKPLLITLNNEKIEVPSIEHIREEEEEHVHEFNVMINILTRIENLLLSLRTAP